MKSQFVQRTVKIEDITPNPKNPRIDLRPEMPLYKRLRESIEHYGYLDPIIWNKRTGMIVSGHQRFQVMKDIADEKGEKLESIDVMEVDMSETKQDSFMIAVNKITGLWDTEKLTALFKELDEEDLSYTGFEEFEIQSYLDNNTEGNIRELDEDADYIEPKEKAFRLTIIFDTEDDMISAFDKLKEDGYNVRK